MESETGGHDRWRRFPLALQIAASTLFALLVAVSVGVSEFSSTTVAFEDFAMSVLTQGPFQLMIFAGGYWLKRTDLSRERYPRIAKWFGGGLAGFFGLNLAMIAVWGTGSLYNDPMWALWAAGVGGAAGLGIGLFEAQAVQKAVEVERQRIRHQETKERNERLEEFAGVVSHDLRNPLNVARGRVELAGSTCDSEHLDVAVRSLDRIDALVEDLLAVARSGREVDDPELVEVGSVVSAAWETVATADATLAVELNRRVTADRSRLRQLFENLFRNAIEHAGADVTVTVGELPDGFYVADDGPGIPPEDRDDVFEAGYSTAEDGTGFGLNIVRQVAEAHGWVVEATKGDDGGARFEVTNVQSVEQPQTTIETS